MPNQYKIKTLNDIVTKIPRDALPRFLEELPQMIMSVSHKKQVMEAGLPWWKRAKFKGFIWVDDGENDITFVDSFNDKEASDAESK